MEAISRRTLALRRIRHKRAYAAKMRPGILTIIKFGDWQMVAVALILEYILKQRRKKDE